MLRFFNKNDRFVNKEEVHEEERAREVTEEQEETKPEVVDEEVEAIPEEVPEEVVPEESKSFFPFRALSRIAE